MFRESLHVESDAVMVSAAAALLQHKSSYFKLFYYVFVLLNRLHYEMKIFTLLHKLKQKPAPSAHVSISC